MDGQEERTRLTKVFKVGDFTYKPKVTIYRRGHSGCMSIEALRMPQLEYEIGMEMSIGLGSGHSGTSSEDPDKQLVLHGHSLPRLRVVETSSRISILEN